MTHPPPHPSPPQALVAAQSRERANMGLSRTSAFVRKLRLCLRSATKVLKGGPGALQLGGGGGLGLSRTSASAAVPAERHQGQ